MSQAFVKTVGVGVRPDASATPQALAGYRVRTATYRRTGKIYRGSR